MRAAGGPILLASSCVVSPWSRVLWGSRRNREDASPLCSEGLPHPSGRISSSWSPYFRSPLLLTALRWRFRAAPLSIDRGSAPARLKKRHTSAPDSAEHGFLDLVLHSDSDRQPRDRRSTIRMSTMNRKPQRHDNNRPEIKHRRGKPLNDGSGPGAQISSGIINKSAPR